MKNYKRNYALNEPTPFSTIREMINIAVQEAGNEVAFKYYDENGEIKDATYSEFKDTTYCLGSALAELGVASDHVACIGENSYSWLTAYLTQLMSDGVFVPVDRELPTDNILNVLNTSDSVAVFHDKKYTDMFRENEANLPNIKYFISFSAKEHDGKFLSYSKLLERGRQLLDEGYTGYTALNGDRQLL